MTALTDRISEAVCVMCVNGVGPLIDGLPSLLSTDTHEPIGECISNDFGVAWVRPHGEGLTKPYFHPQVYPDMSTTAARLRFLQHVVGSTRRNLAEYVGQRLLRRYHHAVRAYQGFEDSRSTEALEALDLAMSWLLIVNPSAYDENRNELRDDVWDDVCSVLVSDGVVVV